MLQFTCREVIVQFKNNRQGQRISSGELSRCHYLRVQQDDIKCVLTYCDSKGDAIKMIIWNFAELIELTCDQVFEVAS